MVKINRPIPTEKIKLLLFDLDGTLVDSSQDLADAVNAMLRHYRRPELPCAVIANYIGDGAPMLVRRALGDPDNDQLFHDAVQYFMGWYREHLLDNTRAYPGIIEALDCLATNSGQPRSMAVLSNKPVNPSRRIVAGLDFGKYFFQVYGGNSFDTKKPDPYGALKLCEEAGVQPGEAVIIGDSSNDVLTGRNAGIWSVGVTYGLAPQTLEIAPPDVLIDSPHELLLVLEPGSACGQSEMASVNGESAPPSPS
jgi:phosphoglycolate phosphatase